MSKAKGSNAERELIHHFWQNGWAACRVAGSGSMKYPSPDILACRGGKVLAIECKATKFDQQYFETERVNELKQFALLFNAEPIIGIRFGKNQWYFVKPEELDNTDKMMVATKQKCTILGRTPSDITKSL